VLHFIDPKMGLDRVWQVEFGTVGSGGLVGCGLQAIDHIGQTVSYDEMLSWSLFYTTLFQMQKSPMVDVADPDGLVRSQVVATPDGALRLTMNGAESHRTLAGTFLAEALGATVQHIAMTALGFETLPIPQNYYDDLAARFDVEPEALARMKAANILYDRDAGGEFMQCYSREAVGGLFIEIVQRGPGYSGFGAANAPFRIAAQKRQRRAKGIPGG
jgi:4-hydroxyphenylpyruvate dioxygenase